MDSLWGDLEFRRKSMITNILDGLEMGVWPTLEEQRICLDELEFQPFNPIFRMVGDKHMHLGQHECGVEILRHMHTHMEEHDAEVDIYRPLIGRCNALLKEALSWQ